MNYYEGDCDSKMAMLKGDSLTGFKSENPNTPSLPGPSKRPTRESGHPAASEREPATETDSSPLSTGREPQGIERSGMLKIRFYCFETDN